MVDLRFASFDDNFDAKLVDLSTFEVDGVAAAGKTIFFVNFTFPSVGDDCDDLSVDLVTFGVALVTGVVWGEGGFSARAASSNLPKRPSSRGTRLERLFNPPPPGFQSGRPAW